MGTQILISSTNFNGDTANITFYPSTGGTISLGNQVIPYIIDLDYYDGCYDLFFSAFSNTCSFCIGVSPTPTTTLTATPNETPTSTPTTTLTATPNPSPTSTPTTTLTATPNASPTSTPTETPTSTPTTTLTATNTPTPSITPSETPPNNCVCYYFFNEDSVSSSIFYTPCGGSSTSEVLPAGQSVERCIDPIAETPSYTGGVTTIGPCSSATACTNDGDCTNCA